MEALHENKQPESIAQYTNRENIIMEIGATTILIERNNGLTESYVESLKIKRDLLIDSYLSDLVRGMTNIIKP